MICVFFRSSVHVLVHAVNKGTTIDHEYYIENCLGPAFDVVRRQRPSSGLRGMKHLHDNARHHVHSNTRRFIESSGIMDIDHPPYSPDLAPCDYWLFDYIKEHLDGDLEKSVTDVQKKFLKKSI